MPRTFTSVEGRFKIGLPEMNDQPEAKTESHKSFRWFVLNRGQFEVQYIDGDRELEAPDVSEAVINNVRDLTRPKGKKHFDVDSEITLGGHPGRELRVRDERGLLIQRIYLVSKRMYVVTAFVPNGLVGCAAENVVKTLNTFEIIEALP